LSTTDQTARPQRVEFVARTALMISLVALSIDAMLPALDRIGDDLGVARANDTQYVLSVLFLGLAFAQLLFGPVSDSIGRKAAIYVGYAIFITGCALSIMAENFETMLIGRFLQGAGAAGPRIVTVALVRDLFEGRAMARIMSMVMSVFILVPVLAPAIGQAVLLAFHWRAIFVGFLGLAVFTMLWFAWRQHETLPRATRKPFSFRTVFAGIRETCANQAAFTYTIVAGFIFGALVAYLVQSQQLLQLQSGPGTLFPVYFGVLALAIGVASLVNASLVMRFGMRPLTKVALVSFCAMAVPFAGFAGWAGAETPLWLFLAYMFLVFFCFGILFGNFNALAMEPLGHIAGVAASVVGSLTAFMSMTLGTVVGQFYDGTVAPMAYAFALYGLVSLALMLWVERKR